MAAPTKARRLATLAAPLRPERAPWYVRLPVSPGLEETFPAPGWYWIPHDHPVAVYLGATFELAAVSLHRQIAAEQDRAA